VNRERAAQEAERDKAQKAHNDRIAAWVTFASIFVAVIAASAGVWTGYEARRTRIEDERPFIAADFTPDPHTAQMDLIDQLHFFDTHLVSTGRTPARKVQFTCGMIPTSSLEQTAKWPLQGLDPRQFTTLPYLLPGHSQQVSCQQVPDFAHPIPNDAVFGLIRLGEINYQDLHGNHFCTPFCVLIHKRGSDPITADPCLGDLKSYGLCDLR
jgi:hypothetical protein